VRSNYASLCGNFEVFKRWSDNIFRTARAFLLNVRPLHYLKLKRKQKVFKYLHDLMAVTGAPKLQKYS
jgi:hypothetical protein